MAEYIERDSAINAVYESFADGISPYGALISIPAADVREVVRGKWEQKEVFEAKGHVEELQSAFCPVCKRYHTTPYSYYFTHYNFCPNCGADMREES